VSIKIGKHNWGRMFSGNRQGECNQGIFGGDKGRLKKLAFMEVPRRGGKTRTFGGLRRGG